MVIKPNFEAAETKARLEDTVPINDNVERSAWHITGVYDRPGGPTILKSSVQKPVNRASALRPFNGLGLNGLEALNLFY